MPASCLSAHVHAHILHPARPLLARTWRRYKNILPNPRSRVKLPQIGDDTCSTFINANFIENWQGNAKGYIAAQGAAHRRPVYAALCAPSRPTPPAPANQFFFFAFGPLVPHPATPASSADARCATHAPLPPPVLTRCVCVCVCVCVCTWWFGAGVQAQRTRRSTVSGAWSGRRTCAPLS